MSLQWIQCYKFPPVVLRSVFQSRHKMQTIFILCRSTQNPPFSSQIWSAETSPIRPNLNTLGNILRKMPHDAEVILGNSKGSKIEIIFIPLAKRFEKKLEKFQKEAASSCSTFNGDLAPLDGVQGSCLLSPSVGAQPEVAVDASSPSHWLLANTNRARWSPGKNYWMYCLGIFTPSQ